MNTLEALKDRLKIKPAVQHNVGVKVIIAQPVENLQEVIKRKTEIVVEKDDGKKAQDILEKIKQKRITSVVRKTKEDQIPMKVSQAPIIVEEEDKKKKPKKLKISPEISKFKP